MADPLRQSGTPSATAVQRALAILEYLDSSRRGLNISKISPKLNIPKSSAHVTVLTLEHGLPVVMIVGNDGGWGLERELQGATAGSTVACELRRTQYDQVMKGFGGGGETVDTLDQVRPAVERAFASRVPYCLNVNVRGVRSPFTVWQLSGKPQRQA